MDISVQSEPTAYKLEFTESEMILFLKDGRILHVPLVWFPKLENAEKESLKNFQWLGDGEGIHWPELDEDISVKGLLMGCENVA
ncbi:DUF2442 domain-containing protein [Hydrogenimonas sp. SS33]|uniref:DUF2442 domain-containing protein n=1 Tax=Hydrogenimonas leucolamina TaxID=2954236 RepID=UPI00336BDE24